MWVLGPSVCTCETWSRVPQYFKYLKKKNKFAIVFPKQKADYSIYILQKEQNGLLENSQVGEHSKAADI